MQCLPLDPKIAMRRIYVFTLFSLEFWAPPLSPGLSFLCLSVPKVTVMMGKCRRSNPEAYSSSTLVQREPKNLCICELHKSAGGGHQAHYG